MGSVRPERPASGIGGAATDSLICDVSANGVWRSFMARGEGGGGGEGGGTPFPSATFTAMSQTQVGSSP